ncbi:MAG: response regulator [Bacillota bacterium]|nr:response regulator [Bacillota bacterium]
MKTAETINNVCAEMGVTKAELAKKMGILPSSLYRKLARESMTFEELQRCLDVLGVTIEFEIRYPGGNIQSSKNIYETLLERADMIETELEAAKKSAEYHKKSLKELRTELSSVAGYAELGRRDGYSAEEYLGKIQRVLSNIDLSIGYALGESIRPEQDDIKEENPEIPEGMRVLVVDDNEINREVMKELLIYHKFEADEASNGYEAVEAVREKEPGYYHCILMDIEMPVMDGYEAAIRIRKLKNRIRANIPIVALTANAFIENRERAKAAGMDDFLVKPINSDRLVRCMAKFL